MSNYVEFEIDTLYDCINYGGDWLQDKKTNFDNISNAFITTLIMGNSFNWSDAMYKALATRGIDLVPQQYATPAISIYFIVFMIVGNFFITNLFVGVVISTYNRENEKLGNHFLLTDSQKKWLQTKMLVIQAKPLLYMKLPKQRWRLKFYEISKSKKLENLIIICVVINTFVLTL